MDEKDEDEKKEIFEKRRKDVKASQSGLEGRSALK